MWWSHLIVLNATELFTLKWVKFVLNEFHLNSLNCFNTLLRLVPDIPCLKEGSFVSFSSDLCTFSPTTPLIPSSLEPSSIDYIPPPTCHTCQFLSFCLFQCGTSSALEIKTLLLTKLPTLSLHSVPNLSKGQGMLVTQVPPCPYDLASCPLPSLPSQQQDPGWILPLLPREAANFLKGNPFISLLLFTI